MRPAARLPAALYGVAALSYLLDRATKAWVEHTLATRPPVQVVPGVLQLTFTTNSGGAFSLGGGAPWVFAAASIAVIGLIVAASFRVSRPAVAVGLGLVLGGALGNLTDRVVRGAGFSGRVVDFIDVHVWPVFNLADSAIVAGAAVLVLATFVQRDRGDPGSKRREPPDEDRA